MNRLGVVTEGWCELCEESTVLVDGLCADCYDGPLPGWMARLLFEEAEWTQPNAWREYLDTVLARPRGDSATAWTLLGPMWARRVLEAVS